MAVLGLRFCVRAFSSCGKRGPLFIAVCGPLTVAASLVVEHRLQMRRLSSCGSRAQLLRGMWDPPRPGLKPVSPALAGRFLTTVPPGKPLMLLLMLNYAAVFLRTLWVRYCCPHFCRFFFFFNKVSLIFFLKIFILFIYLVAPGLSCSKQAP